MILEIITPEKKAFEGEVTSVKFPGISAIYLNFPINVIGVSKYSKLPFGRYNKEIR